MDAVKLQLFQQAHMQAQTRFKAAPKDNDLSKIIDSKRQEIFGLGLNKIVGNADSNNSREIKSIPLAYSSRQEIISAPTGKILGRQVDFRA